MEGLGAWAVERLNAVPGAGLVRRQVLLALAGLFGHGPTPLEHTLDYPGDPGVIGPGSVSWRLIADPAVLVGGIRALLVQSAHPEVVAGVQQHSNYHDDPLGRLSRTAAYVAETTYGAMPEVSAAVATVRRAHRPVSGVSARGVAYAAAQPALAAWVHNVLVDSLLSAHRAFGAEQLGDVERDRFVVEQGAVGALLTTSRLPATADELREWIVDHPDRDRSRDQRDAIRFLRNPPLPYAVRGAYQALFNAAVTTVPRPIRRQLGLVALPGARETGQLAVTALRWSLGYSMAWQLALHRCGVDASDEYFRGRAIPTN